MKRVVVISVFVIVAAIFSTLSFAGQTENNQIVCDVTINSGHKINGYKYLCMENQGNQYDLEDKFNTFFARIGFTILTKEEEVLLNDTERQYVLYGTYVCQAAINAASNLTLTLRDKDEKIIFSTTKEGMCFASLKCDFNRASDKIIQQILSLNYSFDPTLNKDKEYTSDGALQELERWKRKLDLQIITQEEYDKKKEELMKYID